MPVDDGEWPEVPPTIIKKELPADLLNWCALHSIEIDHRDVGMMSFSHPKFNVGNLQHTFFDYRDLEYVKRVLCQTYGWLE